MKANQTSPLCRVERVDPNTLAWEPACESSLELVRSTDVAGLVETGLATGVGDPGYITTP